jgi:hypothetical protein
MEAICSCETSVDTQRTTRRYIPEDGTLHNHRCENFKSYMFHFSLKLKNANYIMPYLQNSPVNRHRDTKQGFLGKNYNSSCTLVRQFADLYGGRAYKLLIVTLLVHLWHNFHRCTLLQADTYQTAPKVSYCHIYNA